MGFFGNLLGRHAKNAVDGVANGLTDLLISFDPETATKAQADVYRQEIEKLAERYIKSQAEMKKEDSDVTNVQGQIDNNMKALRVLKGRLDALPGRSRGAGRSRAGA